MLNVFPFPEKRYYSENKIPVCSAANYKKAAIVQVAKLRQ
jgi:hypothetical protein